MRQAWADFSGRCSDATTKPSQRKVCVLDDVILGHRLVSLASPSCNPHTIEGLWWGNYQVHWEPHSIGQTPEDLGSVVVGLYVHSCILEVHICTAVSRKLSSSSAFYLWLVVVVFCIENDAEGNSILAHERFGGSCEWTVRLNRAILTPNVLSVNWLSQAHSVSIEGTVNWQSSRFSEDAPLCPVCTKSKYLLQSLLFTHRTVSFTPNKASKQPLATYVILIAAGQSGWGQRPRDTPDSPASNTVRLLRN